MNLNLRFDLFTFISHAFSLYSGSLCLYSLILNATCYWNWIHLYTIQSAFKTDDDTDDDDEDGSKSFGSRDSGSEPSGSPSGSDLVPSTPSPGSVFHHLDALYEEKEP